MDASISSISASTSFWTIGAIFQSNEATRARIIPSTSLVRLNNCILSQQNSVEIPNKECSGNKFSNYSTNVFNDSDEYSPKGILIEH